MRVRKTIFRMTHKCTLIYGEIMFDMTDEKWQFILLSSHEVKN